MSVQVQGDSDEVVSEINVTPLVDVMLVLLVVFIVTAPLLNNAVKVNLPQTATTSPSRAKEGRQPQRQLGGEGLSRYGRGRAGRPGRRAQDATRERARARGASQRRSSVQLRARRQSHVVRRSRGRHQTIGAHGQ